MRTRWCRTLFVAAAAALVLCGCGGGGGSGASPLTTIQPSGRIVSASIDSQRTGYTYPIMIYVPASYDSGIDSYATISRQDPRLTTRWKIED